LRCYSTLCKLVWACSPLLPPHSTFPPPQPLLTTRVHWKDFSIQYHQWKLYLSLCEKEPNLAMCLGYEQVQGSGLSPSSVHYRLHMRGQLFHQLHTGGSFFLLLLPSPIHIQTLAHGSFPSPFSLLLFLHPLNLSWVHHHQPFYGPSASGTYRGIYCFISSSSSRPHFSSHLLSHYTRSLDPPLPPESYKDLITRSYITFFESGVFNCDTLASFFLAIYTTITAACDLLLTRPDSSDCVSIYSFLSSFLTPTSSQWPHQ